MNNNLADIINKIFEDSPEKIVISKPVNKSEKYNKLGPMINERFGPRQKESLLEITKRKQL